MAKRYALVEEDTEQGTRIEVGKAEDVHVDEAGNAHLRGYRKMGGGPGNTEPKIEANAPASGSQPVQVPVGANQVVTITIQVAPANLHQHNHGHGDCNCGKNRDGGCQDCNKHQGPTSPLPPEEERQITEERRGWGFGSERDRNVR